MPARDGTGPLGQGTMTGRGAGLCRGNPNKNANGKNWFSRFSFTNCFGARRYQCMTVNTKHGVSNISNESEQLKQQIETVENHLVALKNQLSELERK